MGCRAVFLDRDGVLNELVVRDGHSVSPRREEEFVLRPEAGPAVRRLKALGLRLFVVTNQPDVARGLMTQGALDAMHARLRSALPLDDLGLCPPDDADGCGCRKPKDGLLRLLAERWDVDLARSFVVGDSWRDAGAGRAAGCRTVLVKSGAGAAEGADCTAGSLDEATAVIAAWLHSDEEGEP